MRTGKSGASWSQLWKRNAVVVAIALFVCAAVYLNWNYEQEAQAGKTLGQSTMVGSETGDPLVKGEAGDSSAQPDSSGETGTSSTSGNYFATARLNRQQARDSALSLLQDAAAREDADETVKAQVNDTIQTMADYTVTEVEKKPFYEIFHRYRQEDLDQALAQAKAEMAAEKVLKGEPVPDDLKDYVPGGPLDPNRAPDAPAPEAEAEALPSAEAEAETETEAESAPQ